jgi:hypothetical protein
MHITTYLWKIGTECFQTTKTEKGSDDAVIHVLKQCKIVITCQKNISLRFPGGSL